MLALVAVAESTPAKTEDNKPLLVIGNETLMPDDLRVEAAESTLDDYPLPAALQPDNKRIFLNRRVHYLPFEHQPRKGSPNAPIRIVEAADLDCARCMTQLSTMRQSLEPYKKYIEWVALHYPTEKAPEIPTAPFYARVAADFDAYWPFLKKIMAQPSTPDKPTLLNMLVTMISADTKVREAIATKTETYYKHLDNDQEIGNNLNLQTSPAWLVNGIRVATVNGIPPKLMPTVVEYELQRKGIELNKNTSNNKN